MVRLRAQAKSSYGPRLNLVELAAHAGEWVTPNDIVDMEAYVPGYDIVLPLVIYHCGDPIFQHLSRFDGMPIKPPQVRHLTC